MNANTPLFIGVGGHAVAIDRATGAELWRRKLKTTTFCTVHFDGHNLFAAASGQLFCLDPATGEIRWHNKLPRLGMGIVAFDATTLEVMAGAQAARAAATGGAAYPK
jgi:outer membrane protein assembly factor BamB